MKNKNLLPAFPSLLSIAAPSPVLAAKNEGKANKAEKKPATRRVAKVERMSISGDVPGKACGILRARLKLKTSRRLRFTEGRSQVALTGFDQKKHG